MAPNYDRYVSISSSEREALRWRKEMQSIENLRKFEKPVIDPLFQKNRIITNNTSEMLKIANKNNYWLKFLKGLGKFLKFIK